MVLVEPLTDFPQRIKAPDFTPALLKGGNQLFGEVELLLLSFIERDEPVWFHRLGVVPDKTDNNPDRRSARDASSSIMLSAIEGASRMKMFKISPANLTVTATQRVDLADYRAIQQAIGGRPFDRVRPCTHVRMFVDEAARLRSPAPARFLLPMNGREPLSFFGDALLVLDGDAAMPEIVFPTERRVTALDHDFRMLGMFVSTKAGRDASGLNFQAILSDERFVAATRVVLATFEPHILNALPSADFLPMLELEIADDHIDDALDLYDAVLAELGYTDDEDAQREEEEPEGCAILTDGTHRHSSLPRA
jgi:hypothetical protein